MVFNGDVLHNYDRGDSAVVDYLGHKKEVALNIDFSKFTEAQLDIHNGACTGLIDKRIVSNDGFRPKLICNSANKSTTILADIQKELRQCKSFWFSVAFITKGGLEALKMDLREINQKSNVCGKILTSTYLAFNKPEIFKELRKLPNVEVKIYDGEFHTKGYYFEHDTHVNIIVGSCNLTPSALMRNQEWNLKISSLEDGRVTQEINEEFESLWEKAVPLTQHWIDLYEKNFKERQVVFLKSKINTVEAGRLMPNKMQTEALENLEKLRSENKDKALVISATGTGKTYLSAFNVRRGKPKTVLFIAHREQLLEQAKRSYKNVLGDTYTYGILSGSHKEVDCNFIFATVQTLSKTDVLESFAPDQFDWICIDEVHRAGADTYKRILDYFRPNYLYGMTATPERTDGVDIFSMFDHNIAYEIRLQQALEEDLLCPFHYFGITDIAFAEDISVDEATSFNLLVTPKRIDYILEQIEYYGYSGSRARGLVFCSTTKEAEELAKEFGKRYNKEQGRKYKTIALTGCNSQEEREQAILQLEMEDMPENDCLDYIFTVDIMNEGVDIPSVNQIIMLRPTESAIIFVQQLGRGLRKFYSEDRKKEKKFVVILDFIGNYSTNFLIPIALSGDKSLNKDNLRSVIGERNREFIPGISTINFDSIAKEKIYKAIDTVKFQQLKYLKEAYVLVKNRLGKVPFPSDFERIGSIDLVRIFNYKKTDSYYEFLKRLDPKGLALIEKDRNVPELTEIERELLRFVSVKLANGKRLDEILLLRSLIDTDEVEWTKDTVLYDNVVKVLTNRFETNDINTKKFSHSIFIETNGNRIIKSDVYKKALENVIFKQLLIETLESAERRYWRLYQNHYKNTFFSLYQKYTYGDVCRLLCWEKNIVELNIGGYFYDKSTNTMAVFITYHKGEDVQESINYDDAFLKDDLLKAISKNGRDVNSEEMKRIASAKEQGIQIYLFVRKDKADEEGAKEFYFLGEIECVGMQNSPVTSVDAKGKSKVLKRTDILYQLDVPVESALYDYIVDWNKVKARQKA